MNYEEAEKLSLKIRWKTSLCASGEGCWCRIIETEQELKDDEGHEVGSIADSGCISKKHAEYIVNLHNKSLDAMKFIVRDYKQGNFTHRHLADVERIFSVMSVGGVDTDMETCAYIWDEYSDDCAAGWIGLPDDDQDLFDTIMRKAQMLNHIKGFEV